MLALRHFAAARMVRRRQIRTARNSLGASMLCVRRAESDDGVHGCRVVSPAVLANMATRETAGHRADALLLVTVGLILLVGSLFRPAMADAPPLSRPHAHLDNKDQCTACHEVFSGVPEEKCLGCHRDIDIRIRRGRGFHGRVAGKAKCIACHREHLGRDHEITPLNRRTFEHDQTGWPLTGGHRTIGCRDCHTAKRPGSARDGYLGASTECRACHGEYHGGALGKVDLSDCVGCHNTVDWKILNSNMRFNHERETRFPRTGMHKKVECDKCHLDQQRFGPIDVAGCITCHSDPHPAGVFGRRICEECHVTAGFAKTSIFEHVTTGWPLRGVHARQVCLECHNWKQWKPRTSDCVGCHEDHHDGQFGRKPCSECHKDAGWDKLGFDHNTQSRFPLVGRHKRVECVSCHPNGQFKPIDTACRNCHLDHNPHADTFGDTPCANCHSPVDWRKTRFDHSITGFSLEGRHNIQPCFRCHPNGTEVDDDTMPVCEFCHRDVHEGQFEGASCEKCHGGYDNWRIPFFDHTQARFRLEGKHLEVRCGGCHRDGHFRPIQTACGNCHQNFHKGQFSKPCDGCHSPHGWTLVEFDHDTDSQYPLYGRHREVDCTKCHVRNDFKGIPTDCDGCHLDYHRGQKGAECDVCHTTADWSTNVGQDHDFGPFRLEGMHDRLPCETCHGPDRRKTLAGTGPECVSCHRDPHFGNFGPMCHDCHTQQYFLPSKFLHIETGFRLSGAHRFVECRNCHPGRVFGATPSTCDYCHSDAFESTSGGRCDHVGRCSKQACHNCHTTRSFVPARPGSTCGPCESGQ